MRRKAWSRSARVWYFRITVSESGEGRSVSKGLDKQVEELSTAKWSEVLHGRKTDGCRVEC